MFQQTLFENRTRPYRAAHKPAETTLAAAEQIQQDAPRLRRLVYAYIASRGANGATDQECQAALHLEPNTQPPRRIELTRGGHVRDSGQRRKTRSGRNAIVWIATGKPL